MSVRLVGIDREPFWLDEIFSHDQTSGTVTETLDAVAKDIHPPLYSLGLREWRSALGASPAVLRGYSAIWSLLGVALVGLLAWDLGGRSSAGLIAAILASVNPLDVYFAQEARMYAQAAALVALSSWLILRWMQALDTPRCARFWPWAVAYGVVAAALLATHYVAAMVLLAQGMFAIAWFVRARAWGAVAGYVGCTLASAVPLLPWLVHVRHVRGELYGLTAADWIPTPAWTDAIEVITRYLVWGHASLALLGRWSATSISVVVLACCAVVVFLASRDEGWTAARWRDIGYTAWLVGAPVVLALAFSRAVAPVFFPPRFSLLVLPPYLALLAGCISSVPHRWLRLTAVALLAGTMATATALQLGTIEKPGLAGFAARWNDQGPPDDVLFYPRWNRRVAGFYLGEPVLNVPKREQLEKNLRRGSPRRVWVVRRVGNTMAGEPQEERELLEWVLSLGPQRRLALVDDVDVTEVQAQPLPQLFPPLTPGVPLRFAEPSSDPYLPDGWYHAEKGFRWSRGNRAEVLFALEPPAASELRLEMFCFRRQRITVTFNGQVLNPFECAERAPHLRTIALPPGLAQQENRLLFDLPDATSPLAVGESGDRRTLALGVCSLTVE